MEQASSVARLILLHSVAFAVLGSVCMTATAGSALERAKKRGALSVGMQHVVAPYVAGSKFRTPENIDSELAEAIAQQLKVKLSAAVVTGQGLANGVGVRKTDIVLAAVSPAETPDRKLAVVPTGYSVGPMAIMRTDTDIKAWKDLKGRKVCVAKDGRYTGMIAARYGALEKVYRAPADSLLALRTGECDAAVHDSALLEQLLKLPEWKKFSARLPSGVMSSLVLAIPADDANTLKWLERVANDWSASGYLKQLTEKMARNIAFEVYLDQNVPDCH